MPRGCSDNGEWPWSRCAKPSRPVPGISSHARRPGSGNAAELVAGRSPERILRLGFAIVRTDGKAVFSAAQVGKGDTLDIEVADGRIEGTVQYTETK